MARRSLFDGEIGIKPDSSEQMQVLAEILEIEADGGNSAAEFVAYALRKFEAEMAARWAEKRAKALRDKVFEIDAPHHRSSEQ